MRPHYLQEGDLVFITALARKISKEEVHFAVELLESWGLRVELGNTIGKAYHQFAGADEERAKDLQYALNSENIKLIICARGGYGCVRILDKLDFSGFLKYPKWIAGYSDITFLHILINDKLNIQSLHCSMPINFSTNTELAIQSIRNELFGRESKIEAPFKSLNRIGAAQGKLIGGNLSILYAMLGTKTAFNSTDKILFLEDLDEYLYHIDRMIIALKRAGKLDNLAGLIIGGMTDMNDNVVPFGKNAEEIIAEHVSEFDYPVCYGFPAGHINNNLALVLGKSYQLEVSVKQSTLLPA